jgi:hypothetical protein
MKTNAGDREIKPLCEAELNIVAGGRPNEIVATFGPFLIWATKDGHGVTCTCFDHQNP